MQKKLIFVSLIVYFLFGVPSPKASKAAPILSPAEVIQKINAYRTQNGLPPLQVNTLLNTVAQGQSDYQASIGAVTHEGPGGSRPKDRLYAAGYGDGKTIFASEIIYGGQGTSPSTAITWWKGSQVHNTVMLTSTYQEIGAGVASDGEWTYYTALLTYVSGSAVVPTEDSGGGSNGGGNTGPVIYSVVKATPRSDGTIVHTILTGQALWTISAVYQVPLENLLTLNNLPERALVFPGDTIIVQAPFTPTPRPTQTSAPTPSRRPTQPIQNTLPVGTLVSNLKSDPPADRQPNSSNDLTNPAVRSIIIIAFIIIFLVLVGSMFIQKPPERPDHDDPVL